MTFLNKLSQRSIPWYPLGMLGVFLFSLTLRFWGLTRFNAFVFDEVYYAKFANDYLTKTPFFNAHPPLSQYIIALGILIGSHLPFGKDAMNGLTGSMLSPWDYRWFNAFTGSFIPLAIGSLAYQLTKRKSYSFLAAFLACFDALFIVESRYALNNIYLVLFGLLGQIFFLKALAKPSKQWSLIVISGIWFGMSACIKWNGLWFLLGIYLLLISAWAMALIQREVPRINSDLLGKHPLTNFLYDITHLKLPKLFLGLLVVPIVVYSVAWIPHLLQNPSPNFWQMQEEILGYHQRIKSGPDVHPYCSTWYSWILMLRPVVYFYQSTSIDKPSDPVLPSLPQGMNEVIFDVHAMGNPLLWWFSALAIFLLLWLLADRVIFWLTSHNSDDISQVETSPIFRFPPPAEMWVVFYFVINWAANLLPWVKVTRCIFLYHYMGSSVFASLALAWWIDRWLHSPKKYLRGIGITIIFTVIAAFIFWLPVHLGLPLSPDGWKMRMLLQSWI